MKVRIAVSAAGSTVERADYLGFIDGLERRGFDTVWLSDVPMGTTVDPLVGLAIAAGRTDRLKLGANVVVPGRNPLMLAKEMAQLDRLSGGRLLLSFVPGQNTPAEREALGTVGTDRGNLIDEVMALCRRWWAGEEVDHHSDRFSFTGVSVRPCPIQEPLELWLGGIAPAALARAGRLADGWLTARATPNEAGAGRKAIEAAAAEAGREIDAEHFGISIPYARSLPTGAAIAAVMRKSTADRADILPVGSAELRNLLERHIAEGLSKFVVRPMVLTAGWDDELDWLADAALALQS